MAYSNSLRLFYLLLLLLILFFIVFILYFDCWYFQIETHFFQTRSAFPGKQSPAGLSLQRRSDDQQLIDGSARSR